MMAPDYLNHAELLARPDLASMKTLAEPVQEYLHDDFALIFGCTGGPGIGKSTFSQWLSYLVNPYEFDTVRNTAMKPTTDNFIEQLEALTRYSALIGDEGAWYAYNRTFMSGLQVYLMQYLKTFRKNQNKAVILCMSSIYKFDKDLRQGDTMYYWAQLISRGKAIVFEATRNFFSADGFRIKENEKLLEKFLIRSRAHGEVSNDEITDFLRRSSPNFVSVVDFPDLPKPWKKAYLTEVGKTKEWYADYRQQQQQQSAVRAERRYESLGESVRWLYEGDERAPSRTLFEIAERLGVAESTILKWKQDAEKERDKKEAKSV